MVQFRIQIIALTCCPRRLKIRIVRNYPTWRYAQNLARRQGEGIRKLHWSTNTWPVRATVSYSTIWKDGAELEQGRMRADKATQCSPQEQTRESEID
jgi:hypothetical protein